MTTKPGKHATQRIHIDQVALVITTDGCFLPSTPAGGAPKSLPITSPGMLARVLNDAIVRGDGLQTIGTIPQVWVLGGAVKMLGWEPEEFKPAEGQTALQVQAETRKRINEQVSASRKELKDNGWILRGDWEKGGHRVRLERIPPKDVDRPRLVRVDVVLEPYAWTTAGSVSDGDTRENLGILGTPAADTGIPDADTDPEAARVELARRLAWCVQHYGVLPSVTGSATAAGIISRGWKDGERTNADNAEKRAAATREGGTFKRHDVVVPDGPGPVPPLATDPPKGDIEPRVTWWRLPAPEEIDAATTLVVPDRRGSYLGSAGTSLVLGDPIPLSGDKLDAAPVLWMDGADPARWATPAKWPRGLWLLMLPPPQLVPGWDDLPPFHQTWWRSHSVGYDGDGPRAHYAEAVPVWVTTETAMAMAAEPVNSNGVPTGGLGMAWCRDNVPILEGWVYPRSGTALKPWQTMMSEAYKTAIREDDRVMKAFTGDIYKGYIGRLKHTPEQWGQWRRLHSQPVWRFQIQALTTAAIRRKAAEARARIHTATGIDCRPVGANTDDCTCLLPAEVDPGLLSDETADLKLGEMVIKLTYPLTDDDRAALREARDGGLQNFARAVAALRRAARAATESGGR